MRRVIAFVVVALVGAAVAGFWIDNSALKVNAASISDANLRADLTAIQHSESFQCYLTARCRWCHDGGFGRDGVDQSSY